MVFSAFNGFVLLRVMWLEFDCYSRSELHSINTRKAIDYLEFHSSCGLFLMYFREKLNADFVVSCFTSLPVCYRWK